MTNFEKELFSKILKGNIIYEIAGKENEMLDGYITEEEFEEFKTMQNLLDVAGNIFTEAYTSGYFKSSKTDTVIEAKHVKFLGYEEIECIKAMAVLQAKMKFK
ncbi:hypothetical protein EFP_139 [Enterococcus phage EF24C]|jgi:hypothetical protein|uniref:Uncharacterized protein n=3 Tax=Kochikohdavirus TaxID=2560160 RepID=A8E2J1_BPPHE|nr:hypothetical protein EFP_gp139 [Enterococcus phage EF24C]UQT00373.1 hypothetical protein FGBNBECL_00015 [Enterococcus phage vB_OCPT_Bob]USL84204.1 hypothetical protein Sw5_152 [Enterococcus phage Sw5]WDQ27775.1 hypothetical protein EF53_143 [Enterococcus phage 53]BAF81407.1 hypothetical protein EFP_139 [Enterococcus phage EF24C]